MDIRSLRYFLMVADQGGFTAAAEQLHIAQPAVSMAIRKLEQTLDLPLFNRHERRVTLTDEGEVLARHARLILQAVADAEREVRELHALERGEVRIGIPSMLGSYYFPPILMAFRHRYPGVRLEVIEAGTRKIQTMIHRGDIDMGVIVTDTIASATIETSHGPAAMITAPRKVLIGRNRLPPSHHVSAEPGPLAASSLLGVSSCRLMPPLIPRIA